MNASNFDRPQEIRIRRVHADAILPTRTHADDAGMDLYCLESVLLPPLGGCVTRTGIALAIPEGWVGLVADRSSMAKRGIKTSGGVIDAGYRGEIHIVLRNLSNEVIELNPGERIAQLLLLPVATPRVVEVAELDQTSRGEKGFGSSGK